MDGEELVADDFEEIHTGRRLIRTYRISQCLSVAAVVLDSADPLGDVMANRCVAILVPHGRELDWMYSTEGGQWQLLAVAGVSRLIILSRRWNTLALCPKIEVVRKPSAGDESITAPTTLQSEARPRAKGRRPKFEIHPRCMDQPDRNELIEADAHPDKRNVAENGTADGRVKRRQKGRRDHSHALSKRQESDEHDGTRSRKVKDLQQRNTSIPNEVSKLSNLNDGEEAWKFALQAVLISLCPRVAVEGGIPAVPFVEYTDNVVQRVVVEEMVSPLTGLMRVEDVELDTEINEVDDPMASRREPPADEGSRGVKQFSKSWRRRLIFQRMPNLIQTEVRLTPFALVDCIRERSQKGEGTNDTGQKHLTRNAYFNDVSDNISIEAAERQVDHSRLVHKYLPPIIAGFVLVGSCLDSCLVPGARRARVLSIGVGGGALPIFLQKYFHFHIQAVEIDEVVLRLAKDHFGLREDAHFQATVADGLAVVEDIAARAIQQGVVDDQIKRSWTRWSRGSTCQLSSCPNDFQLSEETIRLPSVSIQGSLACSLKEGKCETASDIGPVGGRPLKACCTQLNYVQKGETPGLSGGLEVSSCSHSSSSSCFHQCLCDPRVELIILDVDVGDARLDLSSPPLSFLEPKFLLAARIAVQDGGMLAVNVVPCKEGAFMAVINSLKVAFAEVYEIDLKEDVQHVVFALPTPISDDCRLRNGHTVHRVRQIVGDGLIQCIRRLEPRGGNEIWPSLIPD